MEYLDVCGENGRPTGEIVERDEAHRNGILHRTSHVWVIREEDGEYQVLLQRRSLKKESFPGMFDASSAGHIPAGDDPRRSAVREMGEEIGLYAQPEELAFAGMFRCSYESVFHGRMFRDNEVRFAYVFREPVAAEHLKLQESEVDEVRWFPLKTVEEEVRSGSDRICVSREGLETLMRYLERA